MTRTRDNMITGPRLRRLRPPRLFLCGAPLLAALLASTALAPRVSLALDPARALAQYVHDRFTDRQGLPENSVRALLFSRRGELWIGTDEGLARFDGGRFTVYDRRTSPALGSNLVYSLSEDAEGAIWIGTMDAGVYRLESGVVTAASFPKPLPSQQVSSLLDDGHGTLWVGTRRGLARVAEGKMAVFDTTSGLPSDEVRAIVRLRDGRICIGTNGGAAVVEGGAIHPGPAELHGMIVTAILENGDGLWFATDGHGLARVPRSGQLEFLGTAENVPQEVHSLFLDRDGTVWLGGNEGLLRLKKGRAERFVGRGGEEPLRTWAIAEDREGNLWTGSEGGGLERLRDGDFVTIGMEEGLPHEVSTVVLEDSDKNLWIGTYGGLSVAKGGDLERLRTVVTGRRPVTSLADDRSGTIWFGFLDGALSKVSNGVLSQVVSPTPGRAVSSLTLSQDGTVLAGTFQGLFRLDGTELVPEGDPGLPARVRINGLSWAPDGALWAGLEFRGAYRRGPGGHFERVEAIPPGHDLNDFLIDNDGTVWMGTLGAGLWRWRAGKSEGVTTRQGLFDDVIWRVLDDGLGHLWMTCNKGVFRVDREELEAVLDGRAAAVTSWAYGIDDGMRSRECDGGVQPSGWRTVDGRLFVPTVKGVSIVDPARLKPAPVAPVVIDRVVVDGAERPSPVALKLPPGSARLTIGYSALAFSSPESIRFRYRLEGHDRDWIDAADERIATYTNLPPGRYRFYVEARVAHGTFGEAAVLPVEQQARLTQMPWFQALISVLAFAAVGLGALVRVRQIRAREVALQFRVQRALADIRQLEKLLPVCAWCKKVRDDEGYWKGIEVYLHDRGVADVTHAMCPECLARHYPEENGRAKVPKPE